MADFEGKELSGGLRIRFDFVERSDAVARSHFSGILAVVREVGMGEKARFVANETVVFDFAWVEDYLDFDVFGDGLQGGSKFCDEDFFGF